ncbi:hypothetical protein [Ottowia sp.]|uniref:hypothetical protein n=1 Tax=Ottowia sp. TaxID=1898956 RepID=UPI00261C8F54|nr:hypothetical protein [Ottowia sp.]
MFDALVTALAWLLIVLLSLASVGLLLAPLAVFLLHRDSMADLDELLERRYGPSPR